MSDNISGAVAARTPSESITRADSVDPRPDSPGYRSTALRHPKQPLVVAPHTLTELTGPVFGPSAVGAHDHDLTRQHAGEPVGQRIIVEGRVLDENGRPVPSTLIEVWQANAAGRYAHKSDGWNAPLDPNFSGGGRVLTDRDGHYRLISIRPGAYPWGNHHNAWRPAHIHFSLFGQAFLMRLVTQMYFPGDALLALDPIYNSIPEGARERLISRLDMSISEPSFALGYRFDLVLRGSGETPMVG